MPFHFVPPELQNISSQIAQEAYLSMTIAEHVLQDTNPGLWRERYNEACRRVLRGRGLLPKLPTDPEQMSLPFQRQA